MGEENSLHKNAIFSVNCCIQQKQIFIVIAASTLALFIAIPKKNRAKRRAERKIEVTVGKEEIMFQNDATNFIFLMPDYTCECTIFFPSQQQSAASSDTFTTCLFRSMLSFDARLMMST